MTVDSDTSPYWGEVDAAARSLLGVAVLVASALAAALTLVGMPSAHAQRGTAARCESCTPIQLRPALLHAPLLSSKAPSR